MMDKKSWHRMFCFHVLTVLISVLIQSTANAYQVGHAQLALTDPARADRAVSAELYYPAPTAGDDVAPADGQFPLIVFAHGYQQLYSDYHVYWETLVPLGYIMVFPTTETGDGIDIDAYAQDLVFLLSGFRDDTLTGSPVSSNDMNGKSALMGHSTGGGAAYLAQAAGGASDTIVSLAALGYTYGPITGTSPIDQAFALEVSSLILSGKEDCICPADTHQEPIYNALLSATKALVTITQGDHCGFSDSLNCAPAELVSCGFAGQNTTISDTQQTDLALERITHWLDHFLKAAPDAWTQFSDLTGNDPDTSDQFSDGEKIPAAPVFNAGVNGLTVDFSWTAVQGAFGYQLFYAPYPYEGPATIEAIDMSAQTGATYTLWSGAAFYTAVQSYNALGNSGYSNVELIQIP